MDLIAAGTDIDYDGASGPLEFDGNGEPLEVSYGLYRIGDNNRIDPSLTRVHPGLRHRQVPGGTCPWKARAKATAC